MTDNRYYRRDDPMEHTTLVMVPTAGLGTFGEWSKAAQHRLNALTGKWLDGQEISPAPVPLPEPAWMLEHRAGSVIIWLNATIDTPEKFETAIWAARGCVSGFAEDLARSPGKIPPHAIDPAYIVQETPDYIQRILTAVNAPDQPLRGSRRIYV